MRLYHLQLLQALTPADHVARNNFSIKMLVVHDDFLRHLVFSDKATFHLSGKVNRHNVHIWGMEDPYATVQQERDSPKVNVFCAILPQKVYGPFFFLEKTVTGISYLDMLQFWFFPQLEDEPQNFIWQQDGAPPHFLHNVQEWLNEVLP
jgi:hypothetical protein